jgi:N-acetylated-alpha-linked acidic dipeptidase
MPDEQTPLIRTVRVGQPIRRYPHNILRRFCTIALSSTLIWLTLAFFVSLLLDPEPWRHHGGHNHNGRWEWPVGPGKRLSDEELKKILLDTPSSSKAREWLKYYTEGAHLAGQNYSQV